MCLRVIGRQIQAVEKTLLVDTELQKHLAYLTHDGSLVFSTLPSKIFPYFG